MPSTFAVGARRHIRESPDPKVPKTRAGKPPPMGPDDDQKPDDLHRRWTERLAKWVRRPEDAEASAEPSTAAPATTRDGTDPPGRDSGSRAQPEP